MPLRRAMRKADRHLGRNVLGNIMALYGAHAANYVLPLATVPYLFRVLGPASWGLVAIAQGLGNYLTLIVDYGFSLSATREVARSAGDRDRLADILAGVAGAKSLLAAAGLLLAVAVLRWIPAMQEQPAILWAGVINGIALGLNPLWFFQGRERMKMIAALEIGAKIIAAIGIFVFVHSPAHAWRVLALQAGASLCSTLTGLVVAYRDVPFRIPTLSQIGQAMQQGWSMFLFRSSGMLYTAGNSFLLGLFAVPQVVGYFGAAEKLSRAFMGMLNPFNQALYPRLSRLLKENPNDGVRLFRLNAIVSGGGGILMGLVVFAGAPLLVRILLGPGLQPVIPVLRLMALLPALAAINTVLCTQWMVPLGHESAVNWIIVAAGLLNVVLACILAPRFQAMGMAASVLCAELFIAVACCTLMLRGRAEVPIPQAAPVCANAQVE